MNAAPRRRAHQVPGEILLLDENILAAPARAREFSAFSGIEMRDLVVSPLASVPVPMYNFAHTYAGPTGQRRWAGVRPEAMWHPLLWLPARLSSRYRYKDRENNTVFENDDQWAARVVMELTGAGLYDPATGEWVDVLATAGIDIDDDLDLARVEDWLEGEPDDVLDDLSLDDVLRQEDNETWALVSVLVLEDVLWQASWALTANSLIELLDLAFLTDAERVVRAARTAANLGVALLGPARSDAYEQPIAKTLGDLMLRLSRIDHEHERASATINELFDALNLIREVHWPALEALHDAGGDDAPDGSGAPDDAAGLSQPAGALR